MYFYNFFHLDKQKMHKNWHTEYFYSRVSVLVKFLSQWAEVLFDSWLSPLNHQLKSSCSFCRVSPECIITLFPSPFVTDQRSATSTLKAETCDTTWLEFVCSFISWVQQVCSQQDDTDTFPLHRTPADHTAAWSSGQHQTSSKRLQ